MKCPYLSREKWANIHFLACHLFWIDLAETSSRANLYMSFLSVFRCHLYSHPNVLECAVIGTPDEKWGEAVKAFVVLKETETILPDRLIEFCRERLAGFKTPKFIEFLPSLPRTASGKILKRELRENRNS